MKKIILFLPLLSLALFGCNLFAVVPPDLSATVTSAVASLPSATPVVLAATSLPDTLTPTPSPTAAWTETQTQTPASTEMMTATPTQTPALSVTEGVTPIPAYATLRGEVNVEKASCRYGPGARYLYLYGLLQGANQDVIGRTDTGNWVLTRSRGDNKSCWVKAEFLNLNGDVMSLEMVYPDKYFLPPSNQGYLPPWDVSAARSGDQVTITWKSEALRAGDEESATSVLYIVEVWVCQGGQLVFTPIGAYSPQVSVTDESGCSEPSHGRVFFSEKHGYAGPSEIPWP